MEHMLASAEMPLVTIGLPVYNGMPTIGKALETLLLQDYPNLQIIISDNASTDATLAICEEFARGDSRIRIIRKQVNEGAVANFRTVLDAAEGEFFMWAAADDYWYPQFVSRLLPALRADAAVGVVMCAVDRRLPDGTPFDLIRFRGDMNPNGMGHLRLLGKILSGAKYNLFIYGVFRKPLLQRAMRHFPEVLGGDRQFICQIALATRFAYLDEVLLTRTHQPSHHDSYMATMAQRGTLRQQLFSFTKMILASGIIPNSRKAILPYALLQYTVLGLRHKPARGLNIMRRILRKFYLAPGLIAGMGGGIGALVAILGYLIWRDVLSTGVALVLIWTTLLAVVSCLAVRCWIIQCQKTLLQKITEQSEGKSPERGDRLYKTPAAFEVKTHSGVRPADAESHETIKQTEPMA